MPYRSDGKRRQQIDIGIGSSMVGGTPPPPIPERILDGIPGIIVWFTLLYSIASAVAFPRTLLFLAAIVGLYSAVRFLIAGVSNFIGLRQIKQWEEIDWLTHYNQHKTAGALAWDTVRHIVIIPAYKEPDKVLCRSLDNLKAQYEARRRIIIVLALEEGEEGAAEKGERIRSIYNNSFLEFHYTIHPKGLPGEMQCKSANELWAIRQVKHSLIDERHHDIDTFCVTTMDADTRWHPHHFYAQTALFALDENRHERFWQAPIRYHGNIWDINPLLRIVNAYSTALELAYLAAPFWRAMPMSSYALSLRLLEESGYWDGDVIADEWHMYIKAYFASNGKLRLQQIMLPFMADATFGSNLWQELKERYQQTLRHAWGSKEVGYTIAKMIDNPGVNFWSAMRLLIRISHDILLAGAGWVILTVGSQLPLVFYPELAPVDLSLLLRDAPQALSDAAANLAANPTWIMLIAAGFLVVVLGAVFWLQDVIVRPPRTHPRTPSEIFWTVLSFPLLPVLTLFVVAIPTIQAQTRLLLGIPLRFRVTPKS